MITPDEYFTNPTTREVKEHTAEHEENARILLVRRNTLRQEWCEVTGRTCPIDPDTGTEISGVRGGHGDGGFRLNNASTGKALSSHKEARGVDDYDPDEAFDTWLDTFETPDGGNTKLEEYELYREHPAHTKGWCHLTTRAPRSGKRTFLP